MNTRALHPDKPDGNPWVSTSDGNPWVAVSTGYGMTSVQWDRSGPAVRLAVVELCKWCTRSGKATATGRKIARTPWDKLSPAARRVLSLHGILP